MAEKTTPMGKFRKDVERDREIIKEKSRDIRKKFLSLTLDDLIQNLDPNKFSAYRRLHEEYFYTDNWFNAHLGKTVDDRHYLVVRVRGIPFTERTFREQQVNKLYASVSSRISSN